MNSKLYFGIVAFAVAQGFGTTVVAHAADPDHAAHHAKDPSTTTDTQGPLAPLAQALDQNHPNMQSKTKAKKMKMSPAQTTPPAMAMPASGGGKPGGMPNQAGGMMKAMEPMMNSMMGSMGQTPSQAADPASPERPGIPGGSHIFHVGATGFFLDHQDLVPLSQEQQQSLNQIKTNALFDQSSRDRKVAQAEQELWSLTSPDKPDLKVIDRKVKEIESLKGEQRIAFIRSVNEASKILRADQRNVILGRASPQNSMGSMGAGAAPSQQMGSPPSGINMPASKTSNGNGMAGARPSGMPSTAPQATQPASAPAAANGMGGGGMKKDQGEMGGM